MPSQPRCTQPQLSAILTANPGFYSCGYPAHYRGGAGANYQAFYRAFWNLRLYYQAFYMFFPIPHPRLSGVHTCFPDSTATAIRGSICIFKSSICPIRREGRIHGDCFTRLCLRAPTTPGIMPIGIIQTKELLDFAPSLTALPAWPSNTR